MPMRSPERVAIAGDYPPTERRWKERSRRKSVVSGPPPVPPPPGTRIALPAFAAVPIPCSGVLRPPPWRWPGGPQAVSPGRPRSLLRRSLLRRSPHRRSPHRPSPFFLSPSSPSRSPLLAGPDFRGMDLQYSRCVADESIFKPRWSSSGPAIRLWDGMARWKGRSGGTT